jgi:hypothetical protein
MTATMSTASACPRIRTTTTVTVRRRRRHRPAAPAITPAAAVRRSDTAPPPPAITIRTPATQRDPADAARRSFRQPVVAERQRRFAAVPAAQGRHILCDMAAMAVAATPNRPPLCRTVVRQSLWHRNMSDHVKELPVVACRRGMAGLAMATVAYRRGMAGLAIAAVANRRGMAGLATAAVAFRRVAIEARRRAAAAPLGLPLATEVKKKQCNLIVTIVLFLNLHDSSSSYWKTEYIAFKLQCFFCI